MRCTYITTYRPFNLDSNRFGQINVLLKMVGQVMAVYCTPYGFKIGKLIFYSSFTAGRQTRHLRLIQKYQSNKNTNYNLTVKFSFKQTSELIKNSYIKAIVYKNKYMFILFWSVMKKLKQHKTKASNIILNRGFF